jgi:hypothetical protein
LSAGGSGAEGRAASVSTRRPLRPRQKGCGTLEKPVGPSTRRKFLIEFAAQDRVRVFAYSGKGNEDWGDFFYETSISTDHQSSFQLTDGEFSGRLLIATTSGSFMINTNVKKSMTEAFRLSSTTSQRAGPPARSESTADASVARNKFH